MKFSAQFILLLATASVLANFSSEPQSEPQSESQSESQSEPKNDVS